MFRSRPQATITGPALFVARSQPGIFHDPSGFALAVNADGNLNSTANPARPGSVVTVWATGGGLYAGNSFPANGTVMRPGMSGYPALPVSILSATVLFSSATDSLEVVYADDAPDDVFGVLQVNFKIPDSLRAGTSTLSVMLQIGSAVSSPVSICVRP